MRGAQLEVKQENVWGRWMKCWTSHLLCWVWKLSFTRFWMLKGQISMSWWVGWVDFMGGMWPNRSHVTNKCFLLCWCSFVTQFQWLGFIKWTYLTSKRPRSIKLLFVIKTLLRGVVAILLLLKFGQAQDILKHVTGYSIMICHGPPWQIEKMLVGISNK